MAGIVKILPSYTYDDWVNWDGQWELIEGIPYAMSPLPIPRLQKIAMKLGTVFTNSLDNCDDCNAYQPIDYKVDDDTILQPDMLIVCREIKKKFLDFPPVLVVEILSPSTALKDRHTKFSIYQSQKIKYYLIVSLETEEVEVYEYVSDTYQLQQKAKEFSYTFSLDKCSTYVNFGKIWK